MLRPPVEQMRSFHTQVVRDHAGREDIADFYEAVEAGDDRRKGLRIPPNTSMPKCLDYFSTARFAPQVESYFDTFGRDAVKVVLREDMVAAPEQTYRDILAFLEVDGSLLPEFRVHNEALRHTLLERMVRGVYGRPAVKRAVQTVAPY